MVLDFSISIELYEKLYKYNIINEYYNDDNNEIYNPICKFCYYKYNNYCNVKEKINEDLKKENLSVKCV